MGESRLKKSSIQRMHQLMAAIWDDMSNGKMTYDTLRLKDYCSVYGVTLFPKTFLSNLSHTARPTESDAASMRIHVTKYYETKKNERLCREAEMRGQLTECTEIMPQDAGECPTDEQNARSYESYEERVRRTICAEDALFYVKHILGYRVQKVVVTTTYVDV